MKTFVWNVSKHIKEGKFKQIAICFKEECAREKIPPEYSRETVMNYTNITTGVKSQRVLYQKELPTIEEWDGVTDILIFISKDKQDFYEITKKEILI
jgi:hypothetical protein